MYAIRSYYVYLYAAEKLGVNPSGCLVFEDSIVGITAAKNAGMKVIAVPAKEDFDKPEFETADYKIRSLKEFDLTLS